MGLITLCWVIVASGNNNNSNQAQRYTFDMPAMVMHEALDHLAKKTGHQWLAPSELAETLTSSPVQGQYTVESALTVLLKGTNLTGSLTEHGVIVVRYPKAYKKTLGGDKEMMSKKKLLASTIAFFVGGGGASGVMGQDAVGGDGDKGWQLEEIVVTSTRRETSLQDTAISVAAIGGEEIARRNLSEMNDYLRTVPGVNYIEVGLGVNSVVTRGISITPQSEGSISSPGTGVYFGEVSISGLAAIGGTTNLKMVDLERVEVLRGPQGTLFGAGALAGAVRNIPNAPNLNEFGGNIKTNYSNTGGNGGDNTKLDAVINIPLIDDVLAVRAVAYRHDNSGYINNVAGTVLANDGDIIPGFSASDSVALFGGGELYQNETERGATIYNGGRLSFLWKPTDDLSVTLQHIYQEVEEDGQPYVELGFGDYEQVTLQFGGEELAGVKSERQDQINITNLLLEYDLGWASLLSSSAWMEESGHSNQDQSAFDGDPFFDLFGLTNEVFSQELRLTSQLEGPFEYVLGLYYEDRDTSDEFSQGWAGTDEFVDILLPIFGLTSPPFGDSRLMNSYARGKSVEQNAFYGELSYVFNEQFKLTLGARRFDYERVNTTNGDGIFGLEENNIRKADEQGTSLKANLTYTPNDDMLFYAKWEEGFRLGNTNIPLPQDTCDSNNDGILDGTSVPIKDGFDSDTLENFELGAKFSLLQNRLQVNTAIYRMNWDGIPIRVFSGNLPGQEPTCFLTITANVGEARSQGFEVETIYQLTESLQVNFGGAYTEAELTEDADSLGGVSGDRLPSAPEYSLNVGLGYDFELAGTPSYVRGDYAYVGDFYSKLGETGVKTGDYGQLNASVGMVFDQFTIEFYGQNLTDENALTHADVEVNDDRAYQLRPRTVGLNVIYQF